MARAFALAVVAALVLPGAAFAQAAAAKPLPPLRIVGAADKAIVTQNGVSQTLYKATPGKPLRLSTSGSMTLVLSARPLVKSAERAPSTVSVTILVAGTGSAPVIVKDTLVIDAVRVDAGAGLAVASAKLLRVPIPVNAALVEVSAEGAGVAFGLARASYVKPVASALEPRIDDSVLAAIPMIRKAVEKFSVGAKAGLVVPGGADIGFGGSQNLYAGAELRFTPPQLERRLAVCLESGIYEIHQRKPIIAAQPIGSSDGGELSLSTRIVPLLLGVSWRVPLGDSAGVHAGAGAGASFVRHTENVDFRADRSTSETVGAAYARFAIDRKIGRGRAIALEGTWLHAAGEEPGYLGGFVTTVHYRVIY